MAALDGMVLEHMADRLFTPDRMTKILEAYIAQSSTDDATRRQKLGSARQRMTELKGAKNRLLDLVSSGIMEPADPDLKDKLAALSLQRKQAEEEIALLESSLGPAARRITPERLSRFARLMREALQSGDAAFPKAYLRLFLDTVVVSDTEIRVSGPTASLAKAVATEGLPPAAELVPSFVQEWRPVGEPSPDSIFNGLCP